MGESADKVMPRTMKNECYSCAHRRTVPGDRHIRCAKPDTTMRGDLHGIANGWFTYPLLFDPVWKEVLCKNYLELERD